MLLMLTRYRIFSSKKFIIGYPSWKIGPSTFNDKLPLSVNVSFKTSSPFGAVTSYLIPPFNSVNNSSN